MPTLAVSVIIVSHKRPRDLERAVAALAYQSVRNMEVIVVSSQPPHVHDALKVPLNYVRFEDANISRARNLGLMEAKASLVAFCDDDAVPDPFWLERLLAPFYEEENIAAAGGFVRGRNGLSYQWRGVGFYRNGEDFHIDVDEERPWAIFAPDQTRYIKTIGTNCAFRKAALFGIGGYDEGFHYYLDDTDVNKRLQDAGYATAIVPKAQIIHNFMQSRGRKENRVPQSLYNLGASTNLFLRKHCEDEMQTNLDKFYRDQDARLKRYFHYGLMTPTKMQRLMRDLNNGLVSGGMRKSREPLEPIAPARLVALETERFALDLQENVPVKSEDVISYPVFLRRLYTNHAARLGFHREGYWRLTGGRFGRIKREGAVWRYRTRGAYRAEAERAIAGYFQAPE